MMQMERRQYRNPPIEEALCEFRFMTASEPEWDLTLPGRLHERLKGSYSGKPRQQSVVEAELQTTQLTAPSFTVKQGLGRIQFPTPDDKRLVAVGAGVLSIHVRRPYAGWEDFRERIEEALTAYATVTGQEGVTRVGLRYINRIVIPEALIELGDYFTTPPQTPDALGVSMTGVVSRIESVYSDTPIQLLLTFGTVGISPNEVAFLLDLDLICQCQGEPLPVSQAMDQVDELRRRERAAFEALITDQTRKIFDGE